MPFTCCAGGRAILQSCGIGRLDRSKERQRRITDQVCQGARGEAKGDQGARVEAKGDDAVALLLQPAASVLGGLTSLDLRGAGLATLPDAIGLCQLLERLEIGNNRLQDLPEAMASLQRLDILFAANAGFMELPPVLAQCASLRMLGVKDNYLTSLDGDRLPENLAWLIAANNNIVEMPNISRCSHIRKLMLSHNKLSSEGLAAAAGIADLEMVRAAANQLEDFPMELLEHPKLAWIAVGSNPFSEAVLERRLAAAQAVVDFSEVTLGEPLGKGAGATVYAAEWKGDKVAAKIWEAERFSDGTALGEWAANRVAGSPGHPSLVAVRGTFSEPRPGILLELLEGASAAASPPSFSTVTRDALPGTGGKGPRYTLAGALAVARSVARASEYLHSIGLMHGDVYLHNTLVVLDGTTVTDARLSDFGAAAAVDDGRFEKVEARSFGWLVQDLLESLLPEDVEAAEREDGGERTSTFELLTRVRSLCAAERIYDAPTFAEIVSLLGA